MASRRAHSALRVPAAARPAAAAADAPAQPAVPDSVIVRSLHLALLWALAVAQPLFNLLGDNAVFFAARRATPAQIVGFSLVLALVPPLIGLAIEAAAQRVSRPFARVVHLVLVALLVALIAVQAVKKLGSAPALPLVAVALLLGALGTWLYARSAALRSVMTWFSPIAVLVLALFLFGSPVHRIVFTSDAAAANVSAAGDTPVVMLVFDEFSGISLMDQHKRIDPVAYPNFTRLVRDGTMYRNFTAPGDETTRVVSSLLTGDAWKPKALPIAADYPHNLFTLLGKTYRMRVSEEASNFCPPNLCKPGDVGGQAAGASVGAMLHDAGLVYLHVISPKSLEHHLTPIDETLGEFEDDAGTKNDFAPAPKGKATAKPKSNPNRVLHNLGGGGRPARFEQWLKAIDGSSRRTLYFKHVLLPHVPWQYLPDGRWYRTHPLEYIPGLNGTPSFADKWLLVQGYQRHLMQVEFVDKMVGQLIDRLKAKGIYDKALVIVTADNGESFLHLNHNRHEADPVTFTDIASTPFIIKRPFQHKGGYSRRHMRIEDVLPTIASVLRLKLPWRVEGQSILAEGAHIPSDVTVFPIMGKGKPLTIGLGAYEQRVQRAIARKVGTFGSDGKAPGLFGAGPYPKLIGRPVANVPTAPSRGLTATFNVPGLLAHVDTKSNFLPVNVTGRILGAAAKQGQPLAIAMNGTIVAVGKVAMLAGDPHHYFTFFVPPSSLHDGANTAQVLAVEPQPGGAFRVHELGRTG